MILYILSAIIFSAILYGLYYDSLWMRRRTANKIQKLKDTIINYPCVGKDWRVYERHKAERKLKKYLTGSRFGHVYALSTLIEIFRAKKSVPHNLLMQAEKSLLVNDPFVRHEAGNLFLTLSEMGKEGSFAKPTLEQVAALYPDESGGRFAGRAVKLYEQGSKT